MSSSLSQQAPYCHHTARQRGLLFLQIMGIKAITIWVEITLKAFVYHLSPSYWVLKTEQAPSSNSLSAGYSAPAIISSNLWCESLLDHQFLDDLGVGGFKVLTFKQIDHFLFLISIYV